MVKPRKILKKLVTGDVAFNVPEGCGPLCDRGDSFYKFTLFALSVYHPNHEIPLNNGLVVRGPIVQQKHCHLWKELLAAEKEQQPK